MKTIAAIFVAMAIATVGCSARTTEEQVPVSDPSPTTPPPAQTTNPPERAVIVSCATMLPGMYRLKPVATIGAGDCASLAQALAEYTQADRIVIAESASGAWTATYPVDRELPVQSLTLDEAACDLSAAETANGATTITTLVQDGSALHVRREITTDSCSLSVTTTATRSED